jgi:hypothetical protein
MVGISQLIRATAYACGKCCYVEHYLRSPSELTGLWKEVPAPPPPSPPAPKAT